MRKPFFAAAAFFGGAVTGVVDEDAAHDLRGDGEKVRPILPARPLLVYKPKVGFVDEGSGL